MKRNKISGIQKANFLLSPKRSNVHGLSQQKRHCSLYLAYVRRKGGLPSANKETDA